MDNYDLDAIIINETIQTKDLMNEFSKILFKKFIYILYFYIPVFSFFSIMFLIIGSYREGLTLLGFTIAYPLFMVISRIISVNNSYKSSKIFQESPINRYLFTNDNIKVITKGVNYKSDVTLDYKHLFRIYETNSLFFLMLSNQQSYLIEKKSFLKGQSEDLYTLLSNKNLAVIKK